MDDLPGELDRGWGCSYQWAWSGAEQRVPRELREEGSSGGSDHPGYTQHGHPEHSKKIINISKMTSNVSIVLVQVRIWPLQQM
jgi:hypothetical protein